MTKGMQKVKDLLLLRKCSDRTISNYLSCINRFKNHEKVTLKKEELNFEELKEVFNKLNLDNKSILIMKPLEEKE